MRSSKNGDGEKNYRGHDAPTFSVQDEIKRNRRIERNKRIRRAKERRRKFFAVLLSCIIVLIALTAVVFTVMRIQTVTVIGNVRYDADSILEAADIEGDILPLISEKGIYKKIVASCPYVNHIKLNKTYPSSVEIVVTEAEVVYFANVHGRQCSLDDDLRVVEFTENTDGLVLLTLPEIVTAVEGEKIIFAEERYNDFIPEILDAMFNAEHTTGFTELDLSNRFSISGKIGEAVKVNFGDYNDLDLKLKATESLIAKAQEQHSKRTLINVSTLKGNGPSMVLDFEGEF